jgi:hypothetical protein
MAWAIIQSTTTSSYFPTIGGVELLVWQGVLCFEKWIEQQKELSDKEENQRRLFDKKEECAQYIGTEKKSIIDCISAQFSCKNSLFYSEKALEKSIALLPNTLEILYT